MTKEKIIKKIKEDIKETEKNIKTLAKHYEKNQIEPDEDFGFELGFLGALEHILRLFK